MAPVKPWSRGRLFFLAGGLGVTAIVCLVIAASLGPDLRSYLGDRYQEYGSGRYECDGTPQQVADDLSAYQQPEARQADRGSEYLRYEDDIVVVGADGNRPCTIRLEGLDEGGYSGGAFIFLGPGFTPGSPAGGSGGSGGGPGGGK